MTATNKISSGLDTSLAWLVAVKTNIKILITKNVTTIVLSYHQPQ